MQYRNILLLSGLLLFYPLLAHPLSMRCEQGIISEGDTPFEVIKKCGEPVNREVLDPLVDRYGNILNNAVPVENWVYGPNHGMYYFLRFVNGTLETIDSRRL